MRLIGFGPVQRSMGGVSVGVTLDAASLLTNPAGMSQLGGMIDFGASFFSPTVKFKETGVNIPAGAMGNVDAIKSVKYDGVTIESDRGPSPIPAFGLIIPLSDRLHFGIGAYGISGMGVDYRDNLYFGPTYSSYSEMRFAPGIAYRINDMVSAGFVVNVLYATMEYDVAGGFGQVPHMGASSFGIGGTVGVKIRPVEMLSIGLVLGVDIQWIQWSETNGKNEPPYEQSQSYTKHWNLNWDDQFVYKFGVQYDINPVFTVRAGYNYGKMPLDSGRACENLSFPAISEHHITLGMGFHVTERLTLNVGGMYSPRATLRGSNPKEYIVSYETTMTQYSIDGGIGYRF
jgi:long-chain fatty acid transport protein